MNVNTGEMPLPEGRIMQISITHLTLTIETSQILVKHLRGDYKTFVPLGIKIGSQSQI